MSMVALISGRNDEAHSRGRVLVAELGLKTDRQATVVVTHVEDGIVHGLMVTPSLADRWLPEKPRFALSQQKLPIAIEAGAIFSLISLAVKPKLLDTDLRTRLGV